ncbi:IPT/TIG domain-containing protein [Agromyces sp. G08B096]|uniref:IPT/TIG domain-containing protein n=1 Tax=Agromyces sp. G08B096 TaxID=3156399 RepID=A0AAU7W5K8_9MICO
MTGGKHPTVRTTSTASAPTRAEATAHRRLRRRLFRGVAWTSALALVFGGSTALTAVAAPGDDAEALGQFIGADLLELQAADLAYAYASDPGGPPLDTDPFNLAVLGALGLELDLIGDGLLQVPLVTDGTGPGILNLGEIGVVNSYASTPSAAEAVAASGAVSDDGTIAVSEDADPADFGNATIELTDLLAQLGVAAVTDELIDQASFEVGALASRAVDLPGADPTSDYRVTDLQVNLHSPAVAAITTDLRTAITGVSGSLTTSLNGLAAPGGVVDTLLAGVDLELAGLSSITIGEPTITVAVGDLQSAVDTVLGGDGAVLVSDDGAVTVNLTDGSITVDLATLVNPGGPNLNGLPPNTSVLTTEVIAMITAGVSNALGKIVTPLTNAVNQLVQESTVDIDIPISATAGLPVLGIPDQDVLTANVSVSGTLAQLASGTGTTDADITVLPGLPGPLATVINGLTAGLETLLLDEVADPVLGVLGPAVTGILAATSTEVTAAIDGVVDAVLDLLSPAIDGLLANIATVVINEQPTPGDLGDGSFTVRALSVTLLPNVAGSNLVKLDLASSSVIALDSLAPVLTALDPDEGPTAGGTEVTITGTQLGGATSVTIDGVSVPFTQVSETEITFVTPPHAAGTVDVVVTTPEGASAPLPFTYVPPPVLTALTPDEGPASGGTPVTITGTDLGGATSVTIDGVEVPFTQVSPTEITFVTPPHAAGEVDVVVTTPGGESGPLPFTYLPAPLLTELDPDAGPIAGGTPVTITGTDLGGATSVTIDGIPVTFTQVSETEITFVTPPHAAGEVDVVVTTPNGTSNPLPFTYVPVPVLTSLTPDEGPTAGGTDVVIAGTDLEGATSVTVDGVEVPFTVEPDGTISIVTPPHAAGVVDVVVTTPGGSSEPLPFTYVPAPVLTSLTPDEGPTAGGTDVIIAGTDLEGATSVTVDGVEVPFTVEPDGTISIVTPPHAAGVVDVVVTTPGGSSEPLPFTYVPAPVLTSLTPDEGPTAGGTDVIIAGTALEDATSVTVDGVEVPFTVEPDGTISIVTPPHAAGVVDVVVTTPGGSSEPLPFTYVPAPVLTSLTPDEGPTAGGTIVTVEGTNLGGATELTIDGVSVPFTQVDDTTVSFITPPHAAGTVDVVVTTAGGASAPLPFTYVPAPVITALTPDEGPTAGGTPVTITGTDLGGVTEVLVDGVSVPFTPVSDTEITFVTPPHAAGAVDVAVITPGGPSNELPYTYVAAPAITALTPDTGPVAGGTEVTIEGTDLEGATDVTVDGVSVPFTVEDDGTITFVTPPHAAGAVDVVVITPGGSSNPLPFTFVDAPVLALLTPDEGPIAGGTPVTITGTALGGATEVTIDGVPVPFTQVSDTEITFVTPPHAAGEVDVTVTTPGGTSGPLPFTYVPPPAITALEPDEGTTLGGTAVTVTGTDLVGATTLTVDGVPVPFVFLTDTTLQFTTPPHAAGPVPVVVSGPFGASGPLTFTYIPPVVLTALSPDHGPETGGTPVTVTGTGLSTTTEVTIDGVSVPFTIVDDGTLTFVTPPHAPGVVQVVVTNPVGTAQLPFTYNPVTSIDTVTPATGPEAGGTSVVITGLCFTGATAAFFGDVPATSFVINGDTQITAVAPPGVGVVDVSVVGSADCGTGVLEDAFTYLPPLGAILGIEPASGPETGGTPVTLTGTDLGGASLVTVDGVSVPFVQVDDETITFTTPPHAPGAVEVVVTTAAGPTEAVEFTYLPVTTVDGVTPGTGPASGGTQVTITGHCFAGATAVLFGTTPATSFTVVDDTTITAVAPAGTGTVDVTVIGSEDCGEGTLPGGFVYQPAGGGGSGTGGAGTGGTPGRTADTGFEAAGPAAVALLVLVAGVAALVIGRRRSAGA